jgi:hypothetical protein
MSPARFPAESEGYTGAKIEKAAKQTLRRAFLDREREPSTDDLAAALREVEPICSPPSESHPISVHS